MSYQDGYQDGPRDRGQGQGQGRWEHREHGRMGNWRAESSAYRALGDSGSSARVATDIQTDIQEDAPAPHAPKRAFRRLRSRQRFLPMLGAVAIICTLAVVGVGYLGMRANATSAAVSRMRQDALVAREIIAERGEFPTIRDGQLVTGVGDTPYVLTKDTWVVDRIKQVTGDYATVYQLNGKKLAAVSSSQPTIDGGGRLAPGTRALGQEMPADAAAAMLGRCGPNATGDGCYGEYSGIVKMSGVDFVAAYAPLLDQNGRLVGAVGTARTVDDVAAAPLQLVIVMLLVGLLAVLLSLVLGGWLSGFLTSRSLAQLDTQLDAIADAATDLRRLSSVQTARAERQERTARHVSELAHDLDALTASLIQGQSALREAASDIWSEVSQPGLAPNPQTALRLAKESAVTAARIGSATEETQTRCRHVVTLMNQVIAEGRMLGTESRETEEHAAALLAAIEKLEGGLGERLLDNGGVAPSTFARRISAASQRLRSLVDRERFSRDDRDADDADDFAPPRRGTGQYPAMGATGKSRVAQPERPLPGGGHPLYQTGGMPAMKPASRGNPGGIPGANSGVNPSINPGARHGANRGPNANPRLGATYGRTPAVPPRQPGQPNQPNPPLQRKDAPAQKPPSGGPANGGSGIRKAGHTPSPQGRQTPPGGQGTSWLDDEEPGGRQHNDSRWLND